MSRITKRSPHARLTVDEIKAQYRSGLLTVSGYLYNWLLASKREGWRVRSSVAKLSAELGICRAAFYKAIAKLKEQCLINFEIHGEIEIWIEDRPILKILSTNVDKLVRGSKQNQSTNVDENSTIVDGLSTIMDSLSTNVDGLSTIVENESSKALSCMRSGVSPDLIQISFNSYSSLSQLPAKPPALERDFLEQNAEFQELDFQPFSTSDREEDFSQGLSSNQNGIDGESFSAPPLGEQILKFSDADLLAFIERKAPDNVRSPRAWARKCFTDDLDFWLGEWQKDGDRRRHNALARNLPLDGKYGVQNPDCFRVVVRSPDLALVRTIGGEVARLQAKWGITLNPSFRDGAIIEARSLGLVVGDEGISLPPGANPEQSLADWGAG